MTLSYNGANRQWVGHDEGQGEREVYREGEGGRVRRSPSSTVDSQWGLTLDFIVDLLKTTTTTTTTTTNNDYNSDITRRHWKADCKNCTNESCSNQFTLFERPHHCRRCGGVFCADCLSYQKRLNILAQPDSDGRFHQVCLSCFEEGPQEFGQRRNWRDVFLWLRQERRRRGDGGGSGGGGGKGEKESNSWMENDKKPKTKLMYSNFRETLDICGECDRIVSGYKSSLLEEGLLSKMMRDLGVKDYPWKRSSCWVYGNMAKRCYSCDEALPSGVGSRHNCVICGSVICLKCSNKDLLVYIPDNEDLTDPQTKAELVIVRIVGCPEREPETCMYLRICSGCTDKMIARQVARYQTTHTDGQTAERGRQTEEAMKQIVKLNERRYELRQQIDKSLPTYRELVDALDSSRIEAAKVKIKCRSNVQALAKAQGDLSDSFTNLLTLIYRARHLEPRTGAQITLVKNIIISTSDYYHENMFVFNGLQRRLEDSTPKNVLSTIQETVDKNAMNSCYLTIKQLVLEVLHISDKHHVQEELLKKLVSLEDVAQYDLRSVVPDSDWSDHERQINEFLSLQLSDSRRLIRPSRHMTERLGSVHISAIINERTELILQQLRLQMNAKCTEVRFKGTKDSLQGLLHDNYNYN